MSALELRRPYALLASLEESSALTTTSLSLPGNITPSEMESVFAMIASARDTLQWLAGDAIVHAETIFGEEAYQYIDALKISEASKSQYARVATRIPAPRRIGSLSWSHHREVVSLEPKDQDRLLRAAAANGWARNRLADEVRELKAPESKPATGYVVEAVLDAAEAIWEHAGEEAKDLTCVPTEFVDALGMALGKIGP